MTRILILLASLFLVGSVYAEKCDRSEIADGYLEVGDISEMTYDERVCLIGKTHANICDWAKTSDNYIGHVHENKRALKMTYEEKYRLLAVLYELHYCDYKNFAHSYRLTPLVYFSCREL
jgi:hypothetical protein